LISKNSAPDVVAMKSKRMAVTAIESKGGGVILVSDLLVSGIRHANKPGSRYGLSVG
jgi:hypothetical protein